MIPKSLKEQSTKVVNSGNLTGGNKQGWKGETARNFCKDTIVSAKYT